ncbi:MAG: YegP family protein [Solirubrobacterales bacterium]
MPEFDAFEDLAGKWRWRLLAANGRTVATSGESYDTHWHALRAAEDVRAVASGAIVSSAPGAGGKDPLGAIIERELARGR